MMENVENNYVYWDAEIRRGINARVRKGPVMRHDEKVYFLHPPVEIARDRRLRIVDYDMYSNDEDLSEEALSKLEEFVGAYIQLYFPRTNRFYSQTTRNSGQIRVRPEHADETTARILVFITDPRNFEPVLHAKKEKMIARSGRGITVRAWIDRTREAICATFPQLVDDPLGQLPGTDGKQWCLPTQSSKETTVSQGTTVI